MPAIMYTDMSERDFIKWNLDYTIPLVAASISGISIDLLWTRPGPHLDPPGWILGCFVNAENKAVSCLRKTTAEIPEKFQIFTGCPSLTSTISESQLAELGAAKLSMDDLLSYCKRVRKWTIEYLDSIDAGKLKEVPDRGGVDNCDPTREEFVKLIWMQNFVLGKLLTTAQIIASDAGKAERPAFSASGKIWDAIQS